QRADDRWDGGRAVLLDGGPGGRRRGGQGSRTSRRRRLDRLATAGHVRRGAARPAARVAADAAVSVRVPVVGIGAGGLPGLAPASRAVLEEAGAIHGAPRQLALVESLGRPPRPWPSPLVPALPDLFEEIAREG